MPESFYQQMQRVQRARDCSPACTDQKRELARLGLILGAYGLITGFVIGWIAHGWRVTP